MTEKRDKGTSQYQSWADADEWHGLRIVMELTTAQIQRLARRFFMERAITAGECQRVREIAARRKAEREAAKTQAE